MKKIHIIIFTACLTVISCGTEEETPEPPSNIQTQQPVPEPEPTTPDPVQYTLTVTAGEGGTVSSGGGTYDEGTLINLTAIPNDGYVFEGWSNGELNNEISIAIANNNEITANFSLYNKQVCGFSLLEWSIHKLGYEYEFFTTIEGNGIKHDENSNFDYLYSPDILGNYIVLNSIGDASDSPLAEIQSICSNISYNSDNSLNVSFDWFYNSEKVDGYMNIHSGFIDPAFNLRNPIQSWQNLPEDFTRSTNEYFPKKISDIDNNLSIEFNYEYSLESSDYPPDVFLIDMFVFEESDGYWNKQKEIGIMLSRGEYQNSNEIVIDGKTWFNEEPSFEQPHPNYQNQNDSYFHKKFFVLKETTQSMDGEKMIINIRPFIDYLIESEFLNDNEFLMFIETGVETRSGRNTNSYLNLMNYKIRTQ